MLRKDYKSLYFQYQYVKAPDFLYGSHHYSLFNLIIFENLIDND